MKCYVLDACALICLAAREPGYKQIERMMRDAAATKLELRIHRINLLEAYYDIWRRAGEATARIFVKQVRELPVVLDGDLGDALLERAAFLKSGYRLSLADAIACAYAHLQGAALVTADHHELAPLAQKKLVNVLWINR